MPYTPPKERYYTVSGRILKEAAPNEPVEPVDRRPIDRLDLLPIDDLSPPWVHVHSTESVRDAVARLGARDLNRLQAAGRQYVRRYALDPAVHDHEDLVAEAMTRTLSGDRGWKKGILLVEHLILVMSSIASSWRKGAVRRADGGAAEIREADLRPEGYDGGIDSPLQDVPATDPGMERALAARADLEAIQRHFAADEIVSKMIAGWAEGSTGPQIRTYRRISDKEYRAAMRRLRRWIRKEVGDDP